MMQDKVYKDINVDIKINLDLENIEMVDPMVPNVEQVAYGVEQYLTDNGDFDFKWREIEIDKEDYTQTVKCKSKPIVLTGGERTILSNLGKEWKFIMRDTFDNELKVSNYSPVKMQLSGDPTKGQWAESAEAIITGDEFLFSSLEVFSHLFKFISWDDATPYRISDLLNN